LQESSIWEALVGRVTTIDLTVTDIYAAEKVAQMVQAATGVEADSWIKTNAQLLQLTRNRLPTR
jgi:lipoprotein-releasing system permease protein